MDPEQIREMMSKLTDEQKRELAANLTDEQRKELAAKMDRDLDEYMDSMEKSSKKYMDGWNPDTWEKEMEEHPFFSSGWKEGEELSPMMKGIQDLKYSPEENTPEELAKNYKEDGNFNFKCKKYRFAVASYTEGLKAKCSDDVLNSQLAANRAAAQFHLGNYRSGLLDCRLALKYAPNHGKAVFRGAECALKLKRFDECKEFCDKGLAMVDGDVKKDELLCLRNEAVRAQKEGERNRRKEEMAAKKKKREEAAILETIKSRGITIERGKGTAGDLSLDDLEPSHPAAVRKRVHFADDSHKELLWPVLFLYPEFGQTDFIEEFADSAALSDHIADMFGPETEPPPWDVEGKYKPGNINVYYEDKKTDKLVKVDQDTKIFDVLRDGRYRVVGGTPGFILMANGSDFEKDFLKKYS